jgi:hypothetical protein
VDAQNALTQRVLEQCDTRDRFRCGLSQAPVGCGFAAPRAATAAHARAHLAPRSDRMTQMFDFPKHGCPSRKGPVRSEAALSNAFTCPRPRSA